MRSFACKLPMIKFTFTKKETHLHLFYIWSQIFRAFNAYCYWSCWCLACWMCDVHIDLKRCKNFNQFWLTPDQTDASTLRMDGRLLPNIGKTTAIVWMMTKKKREKKTRPKHLSNTNRNDFLDRSRAAGHVHCSLSCAVSTGHLKYRAAS